MPDGQEPPRDAYGQAKRCLEIIVAALAEAGAEPEHVVRTRAYLLDARDWEAVGRAHGAVVARVHGEILRDIRPASSFIVVQGFLDPRWLVEIEADAILGG